VSKRERKKRSQKRGIKGTSAVYSGSPSLFPSPPRWPFISAFWAGLSAQLAS